MELFIFAPNFSYRSCTGIRAKRIVPVETNEPKICLKSAVLSKFSNKSHRVQNLETDGILLEEEAKASAPAVYQRIENNYGTANAQGSGTLTSVTLTNDSASDIGALLAKIIPSLDCLDGIPQEEIDSVKDDFESVQEQIAAETPQNHRLQKAAAWIKKFFTDFSMKVAVSLAAQSITITDWSLLIQKIEEYISTLS